MVLSLSLFELKSESKTHKELTGSSEQLMEVEESLSNVLEINNALCYLFTEAEKKVYKIQCEVFKLNSYDEKFESIVTLYNFYYHIKFLFEYYKLIDDDVKDIKEAFEVQADVKELLVIGRESDLAVSFVNNL